jgi:hypothetical protein
VRTVLIVICRGVGYELLFITGDYEKVGARYTRSFLWTGPRYYTAVQFGMALMYKRKLEKIAGSFDHVDNEVNAVVRVRV